MPQSFLQAQAVNQFTNQVTDKGSRANGDVSFWQPDYNDPGYYYFGCYAINNYNTSISGPQFVFMAVNDDAQHPCMKAPLGFQQQWTCIGNDQPSNLGIYTLLAPPGYIALGSIAVADFNNPPTLADYPNLMCVRQDFCQKVTLTSPPDLVWTDQGSGAPLDVSVWMLPNSSNCIATVADKSYPSQVKVYDLATPPTLE